MHNLQFMIMHVVYSTCSKQFFDVLPSLYKGWELRVFHWQFSCQLLIQ